jgi:geranylgeranyl pyrophosphate synthase
MGAISGGADEELVARMRRFGHLLGMGFQIVDDVIDFQPPEVTGKATGGDLRQGIVTLPTMYFFENGRREEVAFVKKIIEKQGAPNEDILKAVDYIKASGAFDAAYNEATDFIVRAKELLDGVPESGAIKSLLTIADYALKREK